MMVALAACKIGGKTGPTPPAGPYSQAKLVNCTVDNGPSEPPSGRAYNVVARVGGGAWTPGQLLAANPPGTVSPCEAANYSPPSVTIPFTAKGNWEVRALKMPRSGEPDCDSNNPDAANACPAVVRFFPGDPAGSPAPTSYLMPSDE